jgi:hypothetical protein
LVPITPMTPFYPMEWNLQTSIAGDWTFKMFQHAEK